MVDITLLGGAREVGRMGIQIRGSKANLLLDYGLNVQTMEVPDIPKPLPDALILTHSHLDHSGHVPSLYNIGWKGSVWSTAMCYELTNLMLEDALKVQKKKGVKSSFTAADIKTWKRLARMAGYGQSFDVNGATVELRDAGHIPGSSSVLIEIDGKRILFTGDINFIKTNLSRPGDMDYKDIDVLITESTYSYKDHPDRVRMREKIREHVTTVVGNGGIVLFPAFAVGRTQELLCNVFDLGFPVYVDGMGKKAARIMLSHPSYIREDEKLKEAFSKAIKVERGYQRKEALKKPCVIISTAGMLTGGPIINYIKGIHNRPDCSMVFAGYQAEDTPGRMLLETGRLVMKDEGLDVKPKMDVRYMDFSDHADRSHLMKFFEKVNPKKIILVHGSDTVKFAHELRAWDYNVVAPMKGETITV